MARRDEGLLDLLAAVHAASGLVTCLVGLSALVPATHFLGLFGGWTPVDRVAVALQTAPKGVWALLVFVPLVVALALLALGGATMRSGYFAHRRRRRDFSVVLAWVHLPLVPLGTVVGVGTFLVLNREGVRGLYDDGSGDAAQGKTPAQRDAEDLDLLARAFAVCGGLTILMAGIPLANSMTGAWLARMSPADDPMFPQMGWAFAIGGALLFVAELGFAGAMLHAVGLVRRRVEYSRIRLISALSILAMPLGTVLGVVALSVLSRPSIKTRFLRPPA